MSLALEGQLNLPAQKCSSLDVSELTQVPHTRVLNRIEKLEQLQAWLPGAKVNMAKDSLWFERESPALVWLSYWAFLDLLILYNSQARRSAVRTYLDKWGVFAGQVGNSCAVAQLLRRRHHNVLAELRGKIEEGDLHEGDPEVDPMAVRWGCYQMRNRTYPCAELGPGAVIELLCFVSRGYSSCFMRKVIMNLNAEIKNDEHIKIMFAKNEIKGTVRG